jgi:hypothetical protein
MRVETKLRIEKQDAVDVADIVEACQQLTGESVGQP